MHADEKQFTAHIKQLDEILGGVNEKGASGIAKALSDLGTGV
jgi:hypothetical protein